MIKGLFETHLYVENIDRSVHFYSEIIGLLDGKSRPEKGVISYEEWLELEKGMRGRQGTNREKTVAQIEY